MTPILPARAARAGIAIEVLDDETLDQRCGTFDRILIDAPCSGTGAWRRNPDHKWRLTREQLTKLTQLQAEILDRAVTLLRPGGMLVYATCSILNTENGDQIAAFLARHPEFHSLREGTLLPGQIGDGFYLNVLAAG